MKKFRIGGIDIPGFPDWNLKKYPFAYACTGGNYVYLVVCDKKAFFKKNESGAYSYTLGGSADGEYGDEYVIHNESFVVALTESAANGLQGFWPGISATSWLKDDEDCYAYAHPADAGPIWSNCKLLYENGTVASDLTFIERTPLEQDAESFAQGIVVGKRLKACRE